MLDTFPGARLIGRVPRTAPEPEPVPHGRIARLIVDAIPDAFPALIKPEPWLSITEPRAAIWHAFRTITVAMEHLRLGYHRTAAMDCTPDALQTLRACGVTFAIEEDL